MPIPLRLLPAAALASLFLGAAPVLAQSDVPPVMDEVSFQVTAERWVMAERAKVLVQINAAGEGSGAAGVRESMLSALTALSDTAEWRFTRFDRRLDQAGLEQWFAMAEARLPETALDGLADRAKSSSRPGLQLSLANVDFDPTLAEMEEARAALRAEIYGRARAELERLNAGFDDRVFRLGQIVFGAPGMVRAPRRARAETTMALDMATGDDGGIAVSNKLTLSATIVLSAFAENVD